MKSSRSTPVSPADALDAPAPRPSRRQLVAGAGVAAAAGLAAAALQRQAGPAAETATGQARAEPAAGYRVTEHVRRYYETTRT